MRNNNGPGTFSLVLGAALGVIVFLLHQAPTSVVTVYVANSAHASQTHLQASSILFPLATSVCTLLLIAYLFWLGMSLHSARKRGPLSASTRLDAIIASRPTLPPVDLQPIPMGAQREF